MDKTEIEREIELRIERKVKQAVLEKVDFEILYICKLLESLDYWDFSADIYQKWINSEVIREMKALQTQG